MGTRIRYLAVLLAAGAAWMPAAWGQDRPAAATLLPPDSSLAPIVRAQDYAPPASVWPLPLYHDHPERGGFYVGFEFLYMRQTNPLDAQNIAFRGLIDADGSISTALGIPGGPGTFIGSGTVALTAADVGPSTYAPGYNATFGWRFQSGVAVELSWKHLEEAKMTGGASIEPPGFRAGPFMADTFVTAPVFNFPAEYAGPATQLAVGNDGATFGIWNAAANMQVTLTQRFDQWDITGRIPIFQGDDDRFYAIVGPRVVALWERFRWRTVSSPDFDTGDVGPSDVALYSNVVSNRMYGLHIGCGEELRFGDTPMGTFAVSLDTQAAIMVNYVKARAKYEREDRATSAHRSRRLNTIVPELEAQLNLCWYPIEGVQMRFGYDVMGFFNTIAAPDPVSFNFGALDPPLERTFRFIHGFNAGIGFIF